MSKVCKEPFCIEYLCCKFFVNEGEGIINIYDKLFGTNEKKNTISLGGKTYDLSLSKNSEFSDVPTFLEWYKSVCCESNNEPELTDEIRVDKEYICNDGFYEVVVTSYDLTGVEVSVTSTLTTIPCDSGIDVEVDYLCNIVTGFYDEIVKVFDINGVEVSTTTNTTTIPCVVPCTPAMESFQGDNATLTSYNKINLFMPKCCEVTITTDAGTITFPAQDCAWTWCDSFDCELTSYTVSASNPDCLDKITTILTKSK